MWALPARVTPNPTALLLALAAGTAEAILLARAPENVYRTRLLTACALTGVAWFWLTLGWLLRWALRAAARPRRRLLRWVARGAVAVFVLALTVFYAGSWAYYVRLGQFASLDTLKFLLAEPQNLHWLWIYVTESEAAPLVGAIVLTAAALVAGPFVLRRLADSSWPVPPSPALARQRRLFWYGLTAALVVQALCVGFDPAVHPRGANLTILKWRANPLLALTFDACDTILVEPIDPCLDVATLRPIRYDYAPPPANERNRPNVLYIAVESMRPDVIYQIYQGQEVTPNLNALARAGLHLTRTYAQSTHSDYSDVCVASSLYPLRTRRHHFYTDADPWPRTLVYDLLKPAGYGTAIISSQNEHWGGMATFLQRPSLDTFYDAESSGERRPVPAGDEGMSAVVRTGGLVSGSLDDDETTTRIIGWMREQGAAGKPFFLATNFQSSHFPYLLAPGVAEPFRPCRFGREASFGDYPESLTPVVRNAYLNAIHECDRQLGRMVAALREMGQLDNTVLVVYGENGEAFHENGQVTHAKEPFEPGLRVGCVVHAPRLLRPAVDDYPVELVDLTPTVLAAMGWPPRPNFQGIDVLSPDRPAVADRVLFFHTENPLTSSDAALLAGRWKFHHDRKRNVELLFDLANDHGESHNLCDEQPAIADRLRRVLGQWRRQQLAYYHYPAYYRNYYPPPPPRP